MKSLFSISTEKVVTEYHPIDFCSLPRQVRRNLNFQSFKRYFGQFPAIPDDCFIFRKKDSSINVDKTFAKAKNVMDPMVMFSYYLASGDLKAMETMWNEFDELQRMAIRACDEQLIKFLLDLFEKRPPNPTWQMRELYVDARRRGYFSLSHMFFRKCPVNQRAVILLSELKYLVAAKLTREHWVICCRHLSRILKSKNFTMDFALLKNNGKDVLKNLIRANFSKYRRLPKECRIPEVEALIKSENLGSIKFLRCQHNPVSLTI
ncbi:hypothetical protein QR680_011253 [Steinernema hermaphroditum]|uniref:Uncharacterized protein n=1 Tax=Steinernema hermaphroditum TaxID=289476 RepID=A0AA39IUE8_9BILA|nr:hypothetical protein QR680_011253 [Steinernema hermaphroditum]